MSRLRDNLNALLRRRQISENQLAELIDIPQPTINRILRGESKEPRDSTVEPIAQYFGLTVEQLKRGTAAEVQAKSVAKAAPVSAPRKVKVHAYQIRGVDGADGVDFDKEVLVPIYDIEVSAGAGAVVPEFVETRYKLPYQIEWLKRWDAKPEDILIARVRGASMEKVLYDGDKVVIHTGRKRIRNDAVFSLVYGSEARVKRLFVLADGSLRIVSDNDDKTRFPDEVIQASDMDHVHIIGQVIDKMGAGGLGV